MCGTLSAAALLFCEGMTTLQAHSALPVLSYLQERAKSVPPGYSPLSILSLAFVRPFAHTLATWDTSICVCRQK